MHSGKHRGLSAEPRRLNCRRFAAKHKSFLASRELGPPQPLPDAFSGKKKEKGAVMKFATISVSKSVILGLALLLASSAFAASKANLQLDNPVMVNGTKLKPGEYKLQWEGAGPNVELSIVQGKNVVAKVPAHVIELPTPAANDAAVTRKNDSGPSSLAGLRFQGKKFALELGEASDGMQGGSSK
jgi:hypothetical protein